MAVQMIDTNQQCRLAVMMIRLNNFLYFLNLRQGTILIAVHQIALSSFLLIIFLVGTFHVGEMLTMLHSDMVDDAERRGFFEVAYGDQMSFHEGDVMSTNNQRRFAKAQQLARGTVMFLYTGTVLTSLYLMCCLSLLHGAIKSKREYVMPWLISACIGIAPIITVMIIGDGIQCVIDIFGGHHVYYFACTIFMVTYVYTISAVCSFAVEMGASECGGRLQVASDERGERLLLLDHAAHSSLLSAAQLSKLSSGTQTQFV